MADKQVQAIGTDAAPRAQATAGTATPQRVEGTTPGQRGAGAEPEKPTAPGDTVQLSGEADEENDTRPTPRLALDGPKADDKNARKTDKKDDKKADEEAEARQKKLEELEQKKKEFEAQLETQQKAGDEQGARATKAQLEQVNQEMKQLVDQANAPAAANPVQKVQGAGAPPAGGAPQGGVAAGGAPMGGAPQGGAPQGGAPQGGAPQGGAPQGGAPQGGAPAGGAPQGGAPTGGQPQPAGPEPQARPANPNAQIPDFGNNPSKQQIGQMLDGASEKYGIPPNILKAVAYQESGWDPKALSFDGQHGKGVMQIDDRFHEFARTNEVFDPAKNIDYGAKYLSNLYKETGSWQAALKRYNGGSDYPPKIMALSQQQPWRQWGA